MIRFTKALIVAALVAVGAGSAHASVVVSTGTGWTLTAYSGSDGSVPTPGPLTPAYVAIDNGVIPISELGCSDCWFAVDHADEQSGSKL